EAAARRAERLSRRFPADRPHALREAALLLAARGRTRRALAVLGEGLRGAASQAAGSGGAPGRVAPGEVPGETRRGEGGGGEVLGNGRPWRDGPGQGERGRARVFARKAPHGPPPLGRDTLPPFFASRRDRHGEGVRRAPAARGPAAGGGEGGPGSLPE